MAAPSSPQTRSWVEGLDLATLSPYLHDAVGGLAGPLSARLIAGGRSNPTYELTDGDRHWILRRPPHGEVFRSAHDMGRESRVVAALAGTAVPVPAVVARCATGEVLGVPFYVMDRIVGRTYRTQADTATLALPEQGALTTSLVDTLVALHSIDPAEVGLADFGRPDGYLERQLGRWHRQWGQVATRERPEVDVLTRRLGAAMPTSSSPGIVHGDYKIDNVMVDLDEPSRILAVLDWEMATLGDTLADLGMLISFWDEPGGFHNPITDGATAQPGFPRADEVVAMYAERRRIEVDDLEWYVIFSDLKLAVILEQIHARHLQGGTVGDWFDDIGAMVPPLLERAMTRCASAQDRRLR